MLYHAGKETLRAPQLLRAARPVVRVTEVLGGHAAARVDAEPANAVVLDCRGAQSLSDLSALHELAQRHAQSPAFRAPGGRVARIEARRSSTHSRGGAFRDDC